MLETEPRRGWILVLALAFVVGFMVPLPGHKQPGREAREPWVRVFEPGSDNPLVMPLETYLKGVVAAEMPASFAVEALKSQAVAARTYALKRIQVGERLWSNPERSQAWLSVRTLQTKWGQRDYQERMYRIAEAVDATRGLVLTYGGQLIEAAYHSSSGGHTESAENYWQVAVPYLTGVDDPWSRHSPYDSTTETVAFDHVATAFGLKNVSASTGPLVEVVARYPSERVKWVRIGDKVVSGRQMRETLGLPSNWFYVANTEAGLRITVKGNGHGIGMSQYGADAMAKSGYTFDRILAFYYRGTKLRRWYR